MSETRAISGFINHLHDISPQRGIKFAKLLLKKNTDLSGSFRGYCRTRMKEILNHDLPVTGSLWFSGGKITIDLGKIWEQTQNTHIKSHLLLIASVLFPENNELQKRVPNSKEEQFLEELKTKLLSTNGKINPKILIDMYKTVDKRIKSGDFDLKKLFRVLADRADQLENFVPGARGLLEKLADSVDDDEKFQDTLKSFDLSKIPMPSGANGKMEDIVGQVSKDKDLMNLIQRGGDGEIDFAGLLSNPIIRNLMNQSGLKMNDLLGM